jgi:hypothetical protein
MGSPTERAPWEIAYERSFYAASCKAPWEKFVAEDDGHQQACFYQHSLRVTLMADDFMKTADFRDGNYFDARVCERGQKNTNLWMAHDGHHWTKTTRQGSTIRVDLPPEMKLSLERARGQQCVGVLPSTHVNRYSIHSTHVSTKDIKSHECVRDEQCAEFPPPPRVNRSSSTHVSKKDANFNAQRMKENRLGILHGNMRTKWPKAQRRGFGCYYLLGMKMEQSERAMCHPPPTCPNPMRREQARLHKGGICKYFNGDLSPELWHNAPATRTREALLSPLLGTC